MSLKTAAKTTIESGEKLYLCDTVKQFPFKSTLSLKYLIDFWKEEANHPNTLRSTHARHLLEQLNGTPELTKPISDLSILKNHTDLLDQLMSAVYPPSRWETQISTSNAPFQFQSFYSSSLFNKIFGIDNEGKFINAEFNEREMLANKILSAYLMILEKFYGKKFGIDNHYLIGVRNESIKSYFKIEIDPTFVKIKAIGIPPKMGNKELNYILEDITNLDRWRQAIPVDSFEFEGFVTISATDVTDQETISQLKYDLLERTSIISSEKFLELQQKLRNFLRFPEIKLGLAAFGGDWELMFEFGSKIGNSFVLNERNKTSCSTIKNSVYGSAFKEGRTIIVEDLSVIQNKSVVEQDLLKQGIKNIIIAPLYYQDELVGLFELGSPNKGQLNSLALKKLKEVLSLFSIAVKRSLDELQNKVQALIKEECTAIHPTVEWRFKRAALSLLHNKELDENSQMEDIVFDNLFPLYGLSDIRDSSVNRNESIQFDLVEHLSMVKNILIEVQKYKPLSILDELNFRTDNYINSLINGLNSGDEVSIMNYLRTEIDSVFTHIQTYHPSIEKLINNYNSELDGETKVFYKKRKDYEESVMKINDVISVHLDEAQAEAQDMYPHYFEKYKTDGVEHSIYLGESLVKNKQFSPIYLKNLRLWQLIVLCGIAVKTEKLKPVLKVKLETTHLILVQNNPLSIRFRYDEKKFDVDGTYNLRYEIMKKRIDKAVIKGTNERLTMPGKIAVVYSQNSEAQEYKSYFTYLRSKEYITGEIEEHELEALQGVQGLKALRAEVNLDSELVSDREVKTEVTSAVNNLKEMVN
jgi:GAF domain-containing protein